jgi:carbohydrate kinase (thermoresistant glucokinase family)
MTVVIVMGVAGSGKTTVATGLASRFGWELLEGDAFHPPANLAKMAAGMPLTDEERWPWLRAIADRIEALDDEGKSVVVACSALKRAYRDILIGGRPGAILVYPRGPKSLIAARMAARRDHFMPPALLESQFGTLEEPTPDEHAIVVDIDGPADTVIQAACHAVKQRLMQGEKS